VPEHQDVGVGKPCGAALFAALRGAGLVHHREPEPGQLGPRDFRQPPAQLRPVVVAVYTDETPRTALQRVEGRDVRLVSGVHDDVGGDGLAPYRRRQIAGALR